MSKTSLLCFITALTFFSLNLNASADNWACFKITSKHLKRIANYRINNDKIVKLSTPNQYTAIIKGTMKNPRGEYIKEMKAYVKYDINKFIVDCDKRKLSVIKTMQLDYKGRPIKTKTYINDIENWTPSNKDTLKPGIGEDAYNYICK